MCVDLDLEKFSVLDAVGTMQREIVLVREKIILLQSFLRRFLVRCCYLGTRTSLPYERKGAKTKKLHGGRKWKSVAKERKQQLS